MHLATQRCCSAHLSRRTAMVLPTAFQQGLPYHAPHHQLRPLAARASGDRSWSEIFEDGKKLAKSVVDKVKDSVQNTVTSVTKPKKEREPPPAPTDRYYPRESQKLQPARPGLAQGLLGRAVGNLMAGAFNAMASQLEQSAKESTSVMEEAARSIRGCEKVRRRLGDVQVGAPMQQFSSTSSINGRTSKVVNLVLPLYGSTGGSAQAQVQVTESAGQPRDVRISVLLPDGQRIAVDDSRAGSRVGPGSGPVIDVDYREIK